MKSKEQLIDEIQEKSRILYEMSSIRDLEKKLEEIEKRIKKIKYVEKIMNKLGENNES